MPPMLARLRPALLDLVAFVFLLASLTPQAPGWMRTVSVVYAALVVALRLGSLAMKVRLPETGVPDLVFHILYGVSALAAAVVRDWTLAALWAVIWALSFVSTRTGRLAAGSPAPKSTASPRSSTPKAPRSR